MTVLDFADIHRQIVEGSPDAILFADRDGRIRLWNNGCVRLFGHTAEESFGRPLDLIVPERLRSRHDEGYARVMAGGETRYGDRLMRVPALHRDGHTFLIAFSIVLVVDEEGERCGVAAILREVPSAS